MPDCLIVHVPKFQNRYRPLGNYTSTQWMALGIFALADAVRASGRSARILHLGLERALDDDFTLDRYLAGQPSPVVAFSIHFHQQLYDTLREARELKRHHPSVFVVAGGMTASFFAEDILRQFPQIDAVIRGEGERPLERLVSIAAAGGRDLSSVPNLVWRRDGGTAANDLAYVATREDLDRLDFCDLTLMENHERYVRMPKIITHLRLPPALRWRLSRALSRKESSIFHALPVGRGCVTNCFYCGGGRRAHRLISARAEIVFRSPERVLESIRELEGFGYEGAYVSFDPPPDSDAYYRTLFGMMRAEGIRFALPFSSWRLPSREFIDEYARTFGESGCIAISPETGNEEIRRRIRGLFFSNEELLDTLRYAEERGVRTTVFFSLGLPGLEGAVSEESVRLRGEIIRRFRHSSVDAFSIEIEPGSPWHLDPGRYGIVLSRRTLDDFIREQRDPAYSSMTSLGYHTRDFSSPRAGRGKEYARRVLRSKCRFFCGERALCAVSAAFWRLAGALGLDETVPAGEIGQIVPPLARLREIVETGLCHRCGSCAGICPAGVIRPGEDSYPSWDGSESACTGCGLCVRVCPGLAFPFPEQTRLLFGDGAPVGEAHGVFRRAFLGYATDPAVREGGTSGGIGTQMPLSMIGAGKARGAFIVDSDDELKWRPRAVIARTREEIARGGLSKYPACSINHLFAGIGDGDGPFVFTGLPCHVHGLRKMIELKPALGEKVALTVGLLCHSCLSHQALRDIFETYGIDGRAVERIEYRGGKLPGYIRGLLPSGEWAYLPYPRLGPDRYRPNAKECLTLFFKFHSPPRCRLCIDATAEFADISIGDPWFKGWEAERRLPRGYSLVIARTERGLGALEEAERRGEIALEPFPEEQVRMSHAPMVFPKRRRAFHNIARRRRAGLPVPSYGFEPSFTPRERLRTRIHAMTYFAADRPRLRRALFRFLLSRAGRPVVALAFFRRRVLQTFMERLKKRLARRPDAGTPVV
ncbi:MAG: Coenzyme F420 hydrogenase/dehydrogenase, beta subunit C-terminal domain [bacterium]|nr:Coenzyme F420 hydrogenase/dehydrogenase, beta subunit C-terminal domain [bacterium]